LAIQAGEDSGEEETLILSVDSSHGFPDGGGPVPMLSSMLLPFQDISLTIDLIIMDGKKDLITKKS